MLYQDNCNRGTFKEEPGNLPRLLITIKPWRSKTAGTQDDCRTRALAQSSSTDKTKVSVATLTTDPDGRKTETPRILRPMNVT